jgi:hypothetical protein
LTAGVTVAAVAVRLSPQETMTASEAGLAARVFLDDVRRLPPQPATG